MEQSSEEITLFDLSVNEQTKTEVNGIAQWANINAIMGFVSIGLTVLLTIITVSTLSRFGSTGAATGSSIFTTLVTVAISLLLNITLFNAAKFMKSGVANTDQGAFNYGVNRLAAYFRIMGIIIIVLMSIFVLVFLIMLASLGMR